VTQPDAVAGSRERAWLVAAAVIALAALVARVHNAFAFPALHDFDGPGHALNVFAFYEGRRPDPLSWSGFHPHSITRSARRCGTRCPRRSRCTRLRLPRRPRGRGDRDRVARAAPRRVAADAAVVARSCCARR
jgi:hypothetical protein